MVRGWKPARSLAKWTAEDKPANIFASVAIAAAVANGDARWVGVFLLQTLHG